MILRAVSLAGLILIAAAAQSAVRATVDTTGVDANATLELMLEHDGQTSAEPDLSPLRQDFDILSTRRSSNVQIVNGSMTSSVRVDLSLSPKHSGQVRIPAITWGNDKTEPIIVKTGASQGQPPTQERPTRVREGVSQNLDRTAAVICASRGRSHRSAVFGGAALSCRPRDSGKQ
jgi:hypothetical protein